jgi:hypothetical protein
MALSEYSYEIEFILGVDNGIADSMSRLCRNNMTDSQLLNIASQRFYRLLLYRNSN